MTVSSEVLGHIRRPGSADVFMVVAFNLIFTNYINNTIIQLLYGQFALFLVATVQNRLVKGEKRTNNAERFPSR